MPDTVESLLAAMEGYILESRQLRGELDRLSDHYQKLMAECDEKDVTIKRLRSALSQFGITDYGTWFGRDKST